MARYYKKIAKLDYGGMAEVFIGCMFSESSFQRVCAIKTIRQEFAADPMFMKMFADEARICQHLNHANVIQVFDFCEIDHSYAIVMEFVHGIDFGRLSTTFISKNLLLPVPLVLFVLGEVAKGLHYVHTRKNEMTGEPLNIIHRDISANNIFISGDGEVKIGDFGISKAMSNSQTTQVGVVKGKLRYMSPEQINGDPLDHRADIYSLGVVLWEALTGERLVQGSTEPEMINRILSGFDVVRMAQELGYPHLDLIQIVAKCIHRDRNQRYSSGSEVNHALSEVLTSAWGGFNGLDLSRFVKKIASEHLERTAKLIKESLASFEDEIHKLRAEGKSLQDQKKPEIFTNQPVPVISVVQPQMSQPVVPVFVQQPAPPIQQPLKMAVGDSNAATQQASRILFTPQYSAPQPQASTAQPLQFMQNPSSTQNHTNSVPSPTQMTQPQATAAQSPSSPPVISISLNMNDLKATGVGFGQLDTLGSGNRKIMEEGRTLELDQIPTQIRKKLTPTMTRTQLANEQKHDPIQPKYSQKSRINNNNSSQRYGPNNKQQVVDRSTSTFMLLVLMIVGAFIYYVKFLK